MFVPDVSTYQKTVAWRTVRAAGVTAAICRATYGVAGIDAQLVPNRAGMRSAGIATRGAYHFGYLTEDPVKQAKQFARVWGALWPGEFAVLDVESLSGSLGTQAANRAWIAAFLGTVTPLVAPGHPEAVLVYAGPGWWDAEVGAWAPAGHKLWVAEYNGLAEPVLPAGWARADVALWQFTDAAVVPGIPGRCDDSRLLLEPGAFTRPAPPKPAPKPTPVPAPHPVPAPAPLTKAEAVAKITAIVEELQ